MSGAPVETPEAALRKLYDEWQEARPFGQMVPPFEAFTAGYHAALAAPSVAPPQPSDHEIAATIDEMEDELQHAEQCIRSAAVLLSDGRTHDAYTILFDFLHTDRFAAPPQEPAASGKLFWPTDPAHPCPTCGASVLTQEPAAPSETPAQMLERHYGNRTAAAPPAQSTEPCPCGDGPGHGSEWCEDYTEKARIDAAVFAERKRCATLVYRAMTLSQVVDQNISKALDAIRAAAPSQGQPAEKLPFNSPLCPRCLRNIMESDDREANIRCITSKCQPTAPQPERVEPAAPALCVWCKMPRHQHYGRREFCTNVGLETGAGPSWSPATPQPETRTPQQIRDDLLEDEINRASGGERET